MITNFASYLIHQRHLSPHTAKCYEADVRSFDVFLRILTRDGFVSEFPSINTASSVKQTATASGEDLALFVESLKNTHKPVSINRKISAIRSYHRWMETAGRPKTTILTTKMKRLAIEPNDTPIMDKGDIDKLFSMICKRRKPWMAMRDQAICLLMLKNGVKLSEILDLTLDDAQSLLSNQPIMVGSKRRKRSITLDHSCAHWVKPYMAFRRTVSVPGALFLNKNYGPMSGRSIRRTLAWHCKKAGLYHLSPSSLRNNFIASCLRSGEEDQDINRKIGNLSNSSTRRVFDRMTYNTSEVTDGKGRQAATNVLYAGTIR